jgi:hypothetical protein
VANKNEPARKTLSDQAYRFVLKCDYPATAIAPRSFLWQAKSKSPVAGGLSMIELTARVAMGTRARELLWPSSTNVYDVGPTLPACAP